MNNKKLLFESICGDNNIVTKKIPYGYQESYLIPESAKETLEKNGFIIESIDGKLVVTVSETVDTGAVADRVGVFALQAENPGLLPSLKAHKKKKRAKVNYSPFSNDADARKQHITGELDSNGQKKKGVKVGESLTTLGARIDKKLLRLVLEGFATAPDPYFDQILNKLHSTITGNEVSSSSIYNAVKPLLNADHWDESVTSYAGHVKDVLTGYGLQSIEKQSYVDRDDFNYIYDYAKRRSAMSDQDTNKYLNRDQLKIKLDIPVGSL